MAGALLLQCSLWKYFWENFPLDSHFPSCPLVQAVTSASGLPNTPPEPDRFSWWTQSFCSNTSKWLGNIDWGALGSEIFNARKLRSNCPLLSILLHSKAHLHWNCWWRYVEIKRLQNCIPFEGRNHYLGLEQKAEGDDLLSRSSPARLHCLQPHSCTEGWRSWGHQLGQSPHRAGHLLLKATNAASLRPYAHFWAPWKSFLSSEMFPPPSHALGLRQKQGRLDQGEKNSASLGSEESRCRDAEQSVPLVLCVFPRPSH